MVQEKSGESLVYNQPAGHAEVGEGLIAAAVRETSRKQAGGYGSNASLVSLSCT